MMTIATSTIEQSVQATVSAFAAAIIAAAADPTALNQVISGLNDGRDYGRYSATENPLDPFFSSATSIAAMIAQGNLLRQTVATAAATAEADAAGNLGALWADILTLTGSLRRACANPRDAIRLLAELATFTATTPFDGPTPQENPAAAIAATVYFRAGSAVAGSPIASWPAFLVDPIGQQLSNLTVATAVLCRRAAAISLAMATADFVPNSFQDAIQIRNQVAAVFDIIILEAGDRFDDNAYVALSSLSAAVINDLDARGGSLAPIVQRSFGAMQPALVVAYRLYQDSRRADDLIARNQPPHPAFLPPALEVLSS